MIPEIGAASVPQPDIDGGMACICQIRCRVCGQTADLPISAVRIPVEAKGFLLEACVAVYRGLCPQCQRKLSRE